MSGAAPAVRESGIGWPAAVGAIAGSFSDLAAGSCSGTLVVDGKLAEIGCGRAKGVVASEWFLAVALVGSGDPDSGGEGEAVDKDSSKRSPASRIGTEVFPAKSEGTAIPGALAPPMDAACSARKASACGKATLPCGT